MNALCELNTELPILPPAAGVGPSTFPMSTPPQTSTPVVESHVDPLGPLNLSAHFIQSRVASPLFVLASRSRRGRPVNRTNTISQVSGADRTPVGSS